MGRGNWGLAALTRREKPATLTRRITYYALSSDLITRRIVSAYSRSGSTHKISVPP